MARVSTTTRVLCMSDLHVPYQDERALAIVERFKKDFKPHITMALGDWIDGEHVSTFASEVEEYDTVDEFEICNELLDRFQPDIFFEGNHEERFRRKGIIPQGYRRALDPRTWLHLKERGIKWIPYSQFPNDIYTLGKLNFIHGFSATKYAAMEEALRFGSVVFGHTHRIQMLSPPHCSFKWTAFNIGCLCKLTQKYIQTSRPNSWAHGFGWGYIYKSGNFTFNIARLVGDRVHLNGKEYNF